MITTIMILLNLRNHLGSFVRGQSNSDCLRNGNSTTVVNNNTNRAYFNYPPLNTTSYAADLNALLTSLPSNMSNYGFSISSVGDATALALCRADQTLHQCRQCVSSAAADLRASCPDGTRAAVRTENCTLRYTDGPILGATTYSGGNTVSTSNASDENQYFRENVSILLMRLRITAAEGSSELKAGAGSMHTPEVESEMVYALLQCTPALSSEDCRSCLADIHNKMINEIDRSGGVMMSVPDCSIRYELYEFYNETRLMELNLLPQPPSSSPRGTLVPVFRYQTRSSTFKTMLHHLLPIIRFFKFKLIFFLNCDILYFRLFLQLFNRVDHTQLRYIITYTSI